MLGQLQGVPLVIRELDDLVPLVVMPQDEQLGTQLPLPLPDALQEPGIR